MVIKERLYIAITALAASFAGPVLGQLQITEYMYSGANGEFVEFTNRGAAPVDMTGWSFDDDSNTPGATDLSAFGVVNPGESVILTEDPAADFITEWGLVGVDVIGNNTNNLSRNDQINLYDSGDALVDRLDFGDQTFPGTIRTQFRSGWPCAGAVGANEITRWFLSSVGDQQSSFASSNTDIGNPGTFVDVTCPTCGNGTVEVGKDCDGGICCTVTCEFAPSSTECRASTGSCDPAEACTGSSADCPADTIASAGTVCRPSAGDCDLAESCDGTSVNCPSDGFDSGSVCRPAVGDCDVAEACDGASAACPADGFASSGVCRPVDGVCDQAESCDGSGSGCPADGFISGTVCNPSTGDCDPAEACTGAAADCPADVTITECGLDDGCCPNSACFSDTDLDCPPSEIPTVSEWGLVIMTLLLLASWKVYFGRKEATQA